MKNNTIHIEIEYTSGDIWRNESSSVEIKIDPEYKDSLGRILNEVLYHVIKEDFYENNREEIEKDIKKEAIKEYLQKLIKEEEQ